MLVHIVCGYRSKSDEWQDKWTDTHYRARNLIKAVKREPFKGHSIWVSKTSKKEFRVDNTQEGQDAALHLAAVLIAKKLLNAGIPQASIVPVPSSSRTSAASEFTGGRLAAAIESVHAGMKARPVLYFATSQPKSHDKGTRNPALILPHLRSGSLQSVKPPVVLIDDVMTSGGHLIACARYMRAKGHEVDHAVVVGRTVWAQPTKMFEMPVETLSI